MINLQAIAFPFLERHHSHQPVVSPNVRYQDVWSQDDGRASQLQAGPATDVRFSGDERTRRSLDSRTNGEVHRSREHGTENSKRSGSAASLIGSVSGCHPHEARELSRFELLHALMERLKSRKTWYTQPGWLRRRSARILKIDDYRLALEAAVRYSATCWDRGIFTVRHSGAKKSRNQSIVEGSFIMRPPRVVGQVYLSGGSLAANSTRLCARGDRRSQRAPVDGSRS
jgi:hypothetical protein